MKVRDFLVGATLLSITLVSAQASSPVLVPGEFEDVEQLGSQVGKQSGDGEDRGNEVQTDTSEAAFAAPSSLVSKDKVLRSAYSSTLSILQSTNSCSDFFRGSAAAVDVFKQLVAKVRKDNFQRSIGMFMSGETVNIHDAATRADYRLFDKVSINANGAFYKKRVSASEPLLPRIGTFEANTEGARVLMFLHELGHVMKGEDGKWLLPNDGGNEPLSRQNSHKIEDVCGRQIKGLSSREGRHEGQPLTIHQKND
jgi:hypothetical protein